MNFRFVWKNLWFGAVVVSMGLGGSAAYAQEGGGTVPPPAPTPGQPTPPGPPAPPPRPDPDARPESGARPSPIRRPGSDPESVPPTAKGQGECTSDTDCKRGLKCYEGMCAEGPAGKATGGPGGGKAGGKKSRPRPRFSDRTTLEVGTVIGFAYSDQKSHLKQEPDEVKTWAKIYTLDTEFYLGYFVARRFVLGFRIGVPVEKFKDHNGSKGSAYGFEAAISPGFAFPLGKAAALYGDFLLGATRRINKYTVASLTGGPDVRMIEKLLMAKVGGEFGVKFILGRNVLVRLGIRPVYYTGDGYINAAGDKYKGSATETRILVLLGISGWRVKPPRPARAATPAGPATPATPATPKAPTR